MKAISALLLLSVGGVAGYFLYPAVNSTVRVKVDLPFGSMTERFDKNEIRERAERIVQKAKEQKALWVTEPNKVEPLSDAFFGIYLGETIDDVQKRYNLVPVAKEFAYREYPVATFSVLGTSRLLKKCTITEFQGRIFSIEGSFKDTSYENYEAVRRSLSEKYRGGSHRLKEDFLTDNNEVRIILDPHPGSWLTVEYIHQNLASLAKEECLKEKGNTLGDAL